MGQLETYTIHDIFLVSILSGVLSTYFAEEIEATIESIAPYIYSGNFSITKKKSKLTLKKISVGDVSEARHESFNFLGLVETGFVSIDRPVDSRVLWQDEFINSWNKSKARRFLHLDSILDKNGNA